MSPFEQAVNSARADGFGAGREFILAHGLDLARVESRRLCSEYEAGDAQAVSRAYQFGFADGFLRAAASARWGSA